MQPRAMQHHPEIIHLDAQELANLFTLETVDLAQRERARSALRQRRKTVAKNFPEVVALDQLSRRRMPIGGRIILIPVTVPWSGFVKEFTVIRTFVRLLTERSLTHGATKVIDDLVLQDSDQPRALRTATFELSVSLQRS